MNEPVEPTAPLSATLQAQQWNTLISVLVTGSYEKVAPILQALIPQIQQQPQQQQPANGAGLPAAPTNGTGQPIPPLAA